MSDIWLMLIYPLIGALVWVYAESKDPVETRGEYLGWMFMSMLMAPVMIFGLIVKIVNESKWLNEKIK